MHWTWRVGPSTSGLHFSRTASFLFFSLCSASCFGIGFVAFNPRRLHLHNTSLMPPPTTLLNLLEDHGEKHLLTHWDQLSEEERSRLKAQLMAIDWPQIAACKKLIAARQEKRSVTKHRNLENSSTPSCHKLGSHINCFKCFSFSKNYAFISIFKMNLMFQSFSTNWWW